MPGLAIDKQQRPLSRFEGLKSNWTPVGYYLGNGQRSPLEVAVVEAPSRPSESDVRTLWKKRRGNTPSPLLLIATWTEYGRTWASVCGTTGDDPAVYTARDPDQVARLATAALSEPDHHAAARLLGMYLPEEAGGLRNAGLFASHHLTQRVPQRADWAQQCVRGTELLSYRRDQLVAALGFTLEARGQGALLRADGHASAIAVFLDDTETADTAAIRFAGITPVSWAMAAATADNIPYVVVTRGAQIRIYTTASGAGIGGKGGTSAFVEVNLNLLTAADAGYLPLLCSAESLRPGGLFAELLAESNDFAVNLGDRLRSRVYDYAVPALAEALIAHHDGDTDPATLQALYNQALLTLFRLMFVAYAEDRDLLPLRANGLYRQRSLKHCARELADLANQHEWDHVPFDENATDLWDNVQALWIAVDKGRKEWGVPVYNGGMFSSDPEVNADGAALAELKLTNAEVGPALLGLLVDEIDDPTMFDPTTEAGTYAPVDFASLDVREFGTIYEGLLESNLAVAPTDLTIGKDDSWVPAGPKDDVWVEEGAVYLHNKSGARKASGSYFTKPFAVNHLLDNALEPAIDDHLDRITALLKAGDEAGAADAFFDFRVVDLSMGSGHFLVAAIDRIERRFANYLVANRVGGVIDELDRLAAAAGEHLAEAGLTPDGIDTSGLLRRQIGRRCIYGVDINPVSVDLARMALWVHTFVRGLPLTSLNHGLVHGNALTGIGTVQEVVAVLDPTAEAGAVSFLSAALTETLSDAKAVLGRFARTSEATSAEVREARSAHAAALKAVAPIKTLFDLAVAVRLGVAPLPTAVDAEGLLDEAAKFDATQLEGVQPLHLPAAFPEVFSRERPGFDCVLGNPPWEEATVEELAFWSARFPGLRSMGGKDQKLQIARLKTQRPDLVDDYNTAVKEAADVRKLLLAGPYPGMGTGDPDVYKAFCWRFWNLLRDQGAAGVVLPRSALSAAGSAEWRRAVLDGGTFSDITFLVNTRGWVFDDVEAKSTFALVTIRRGHDAAGTMGLRGPFRSFAAFAEGQAGAAIEFAAAEFLTWSDIAAVPVLPSAESVAVFAKLRQHPRLDSDSTGDFVVRPTTEFHATADRGNFDFEPGGPVGRWPVYGGKAFDIWTPDTGSYFAMADPAVVLPVLQTKRLRQQRLARSAFHTFSTEWAADQATLPCRHPRIVIRDVTNRVNTRTVIVALAPPNVVLTNKAPFLVFPKGDASDEAYLLGVLSSIPLDWYARRVVELGLNFHILNAFPIPRPGRDDPLRLRVVEIAGRVAAVDDRFAGWAEKVGVAVGSVADAKEKDELICELDAAVALLYGLEEVDVRVVFETFHEGWDYEQRLTAVLAHMTRLSAEVQ